MKIVDATQNDALGMKLEFSARCVLGIHDGQAVAFGGYHISGGRTLMFMSLSKEGRKHPVAVVRAARRMLAEAASKGLPVQAGIDECAPNARRFLEFLGFREVVKGIYQWRR